jgi:hypothetical protein
MTTVSVAEVQKAIQQNFHELINHFRYSMVLSRDARLRSEGCTNVGRYTILRGLPLNTAERYIIQITIKMKPEFYLIFSTNVPDVVRLK